MNEIDTVRALNSVYDRYDFAQLRDAMEESDPDAISSGMAELDSLVRGSLNDDVVVEFHGGLGLPEGNRYEGLDGYLRFFRGWLAAFDEYRLEHDEYTQVGSSVVVSVVHRGRGRGSGLEVELAQAQRWVIDQGKVAEIHVYETREQALADSE